MGSEMCIRDRFYNAIIRNLFVLVKIEKQKNFYEQYNIVNKSHNIICQMNAVFRVIYRFVDTEYVYLA